MCVCFVCDVCLMQMDGQGLSGAASSSSAPQGAATAFAASQQKQKELKRIRKQEQMDRDAAGVSALQLYIIMLNQPIHCDDDVIAEAIQTLSPLTQEDVQRLHNLLVRSRRRDIPQSNLAGDADSSRNRWIVKPAAKSRRAPIMRCVSLSLCSVLSMRVM